MNAGEGIQVGVAVVLTITLLAVLLYAWQAWRQADASVKMAKEMREQRLAEDRACLLIDLIHSKPPGDRRRLGKGETIQDFYPRELKLEVRNVGRGPAKDLMARAVHPKMTFFVKRRGYLLKDMAWEFELSCAAMYLGLTPPRPLAHWLADRGIRAAEPITSSVGVVVGYRDVHDRGWLAYLELDYECETGDETDEYILWVEPGKQSTVGPLEYETLHDRVLVEKLAAPEQP